MIVNEANINIANQLAALHKQIDVCRLCTSMQGSSVHGPAVPSKIMLFGQAPGPHEAKFGKPFAWSAGKTLFRWFSTEVGIDEDAFRTNIYITAVARCFPGKASGGGDRKPRPSEISACGRFVAREVEILEPELVIPVGTLAIEQVLGFKTALVEVIGRQMRVTWHGRKVDIIPLPHPSGVSPWHKIEPGKILLEKALALVAAHPAMRSILQVANGPS